ncbi:MAG: 1-acyl-sn-glycerol-3-phosphate acyltransferase [Pyrinomonadaceae bacterium]|nr:1-acyl-sn-glycerol-3-phosphate acyltransferase [Phycisphaerales bacterium]
MSDLFYRTVRLLGSHAFWVSSRPVVLGLDHIPRTGPCLIASNHTSPFDAAILMWQSPRLLDVVSIVEVFRKPLLGWFYRNMNAFPLDRHKPDPATVRVILKLLKRGRVVVLFPEGGFRRGQASVVHSRAIRPGVGRLAHLAKVPVIPALLINTAAYSRPGAWLPLFRTRFVLAFAPPISPDLPPEQIEAAIVDSLATLYDDAARMLPEKCRVL